MDDTVTLDLLAATHHLEWLDRQLRAAQERHGTAAGWLGGVAVGDQLDAHLGAVAVHLAAAREHAAEASALTASWCVRADRTHT